MRYVLIQYIYLVSLTLIDKPQKKFRGRRVQHFNPTCLTSDNFLSNSIYQQVSVLLFLFPSLLSTS